jgi:hypothetical protein
VSDRAIWFAKLSNTGVGNPRMTPVSREGWLVVAGFVVAMALGALVFTAMMIQGNVALGVIIYVAFAVLGGGVFLWASIAHGDKTKTVMDYRRERGTS